MADLRHAPPPTLLLGRTVVPVDLTTVAASLTLDAAARSATAEATVDFATGDAGGLPLLDLRQPVDSATLDGAAVPVSYHDLGGGPRAHMLVVEREVTAGTAGSLGFTYRPQLPDARDAVGVGWDDGRVRFDLWMSDLHPGRYLEQWLPANLIYDRFRLELELRLVGTTVAHEVFTNAAVDVVAEGHWRLRWPDHFTSFSPMLVVAPADEVDVRRSGRAVVAADRGAQGDVGAFEEQVLSLLEEDASIFGPYVHGDSPFVAWVWASTRGMEYDGAFCAHPLAIEHEVFHSWFGRGIKPATAADGWIDEAFTTWWTSEDPRRHALAFDWDDAPVELRPPSPWARHTPVASYRSGARFFAGLADALGIDKLTEAMAAFYGARRGDLVTTDELQTHLSEAAGADLGPAFGRWVHGRP